MSNSQSLNNEFIEVNNSYKDSTFSTFIEDIDPNQVVSPAIKRLIEEVRHESNELSTSYAYDRVHNKHNRGR